MFYDEVDLAWSSGNASATLKFDGSDASHRYVRSATDVALIYYAFSTMLDDFQSYYKFKTNEKHSRIKYIFLVHMLIRV